MYKSKEIKIKSSLAELYKIEEFVETISDIYNINSNYYSTILISLDEAVRNAIEHGNTFDPNKVVRISFSTENGDMVFTIKDEGNGFDINSIKDPTSIGYDVNHDIGKGLFLMNRLSDGLKTNEKGNEISLHFKVSSINRELAIKRETALLTFFAEQKHRVQV